MCLSCSVCEFVRVFVCTHICICVVAVEGEKGVFGPYGQRSEEGSENTGEQ